MTGGSARGRSTDVRDRRVSYQTRWKQRGSSNRRRFRAITLPDPRTDPRFNPDAKLAEVVVERAVRKRAEVRRLWAGGKGHTGEPTAWFAYNGAAEALDHNRELWPTRAGSWRTASLLDGELGRMKNRVLDGLVRFATAV